MQRSTDANERSKREERRTALDSELLAGPLDPRDAGAYKIVCEATDTVTDAFHAIANADCTADILQLAVQR